jgi:uncharacterized membrane protein YdjX (TVP38/TMEM64 family)
MLPGTIMYVYLGTVLGDIAALDADRSKTTGEWALMVIGLLVTVGVTIYVTRVARKALADATGSNDSESDA